MEFYKGFLSFHQDHIIKKTELLKAMKVLLFSLKEHNDTHFDLFDVSVNRILDIVRLQARIEEAGPKHNLSLLYRGQESYMKNLSLFVKGYNGSSHKRFKRLIREMDTVFFDCSLKEESLYIS